MSEDGKTATITADATLNGKYVVSLKADSVKTTDLKSVEAYVSSVLEFSDSVRPTLVNVSTPVNGVAKFTFSEPLNVTNAAAIESAMVIRDENGSVVSGSGLVTLSTDKKSFELAINGFTVDKSYSVTLAGLSDFAGNLISPNPVVATVVNKVVDNTAPVIQKVEAIKTGQLKITLSEKAKVGSGDVVGTYQIGSAAAVDIDLTSGGNASIDSTGTVITVNAAGFTGVQTIKIAGIQDLSGNAATAVSKVLQFTADQTAPMYVSHAIKEIANAQYLIVKYDEEILADNAVGNISYTYVDANQVTNTGSITNNSTNVVAYDANNDGVNESLKIALPTAKGSYTFNLPVGLAKDTVASPNTNVSVAKSLTSTIGDVTDSGKPVIVDTNDNAQDGYSGIAVQSSEDVVVVDFNEAVSAATALNVANYTVEGIQVFESAIFDGSQSKVKLKLKKDAITVKGLRNFSIANVADLAGNKMDSVTTKVSFEENVKPTITSAKITAPNQVTVTFSEAMLVAKLTDNDDFTVKIDNVTSTVTAVAQVGTTNSYTLALTNPVTDLSKPVTLTVSPSNDVLDTATPGNSLLTAGTLTVTN